MGIILHYVRKEIPFLALIVLAVLFAQPIGYEVVAENLGASRWQRLRYVTIPLGRAGVAFRIAAGFRLCVQHV